MAIACEPELTSIDNRVVDMCYRTVERLISVIENNETDLEHKAVIACDLISRGTTEF